MRRKTVAAERDKLAVQAWELRYSKKLHIEDIARELEIDESLVPELIRRGGLIVTERDGR